MLSCMTFVFCSLLELAWVGYLSREEEIVSRLPPPSSQVAPKPCHPPVQQSASTASTVHRRPQKPPKNEEESALLSLRDNDYGYIPPGFGLNGNLASAMKSFSSSWVFHFFSNFRQFFFHFFFSCSCEPTNVVNMMLEEAETIPASTSSSLSRYSNPDELGDFEQNWKNWKIIFSSIFFEWFFENWAFHIILKKRFIFIFLNQEKLKNIFFLDFCVFFKFIFSFSNYRKN